MRVLILGKGFLGSHIYNNLCADGTYHNVVCAHRSGLDGPHVLSEGEREIWRCNLTEPNDVKLLYQSYQPDLIIHFASTASTNAGWSSCKTNLDITNNLLEYLPPGCKPRFILASSATVYSNRALCERADEYGECSPESFYGVSKLTSENLCRLYYNNDKLASLYIMRMCAIVGKHATHGFLPDLVRKLKSKDRVLRLLGNEPGTTKPYVHVNDLVTVVKMLALYTGGIQVYNVCNYDILSAREIAKLAFNVLGVVKPIEWSGSLWSGDNELVALWENKINFLGWHKQCKTSTDAVIQALKELSQ